MPALVALALPGGPRFVEELLRAWDAGAAVAPVDPRLPVPERRRVLAALRPGCLVGPDGDRSALPDGVPVEDGDALVLATSGTTGRPKGVVLTADALAAAAWASSARLGVDPARDRWLACLPLAHVGGLGVVVRALLTGTPLTVHPGFRTEDVEAAARTQGVSLVSLVPTALRRIDAAAFRRILLGGAAPGGPTPANVVMTYGMTESGGGVVYDGVPLEGTEVRVVEGEIQLRGPSLLRAYRDGTDPRVPGGWLPTGDAGTIGPDGSLRVLGRTGDMVVTGGQNVWPDAVERVIRDHSGVADVAVAGRPDPEWGERIVAWVVPADAADPPDLEAVRGVVRRELPGYAAPKELRLVESLPRSPHGKVRRAELP